MNPALYTMFTGISLNKLYLVHILGEASGSAANNLCMHMESSVGKFVWVCKLLQKSPITLIHLPKKFNYIFFYCNFLAMRPCSCQIGIFIVYHLKCIIYCLSSEMYYLLSFLCIISHIMLLCIVSYYTLTMGISK